MKLNNSSDTIGTIGVGDGGVFLGGVVAEQEHLLVVRGVFWPGDVGQQADGSGTTRVVRVAMVDKVDWGDLHEWPKSSRENVHTDRVRANVVTSETIHLNKIAAMKGTEVEEVLPALPH